jgi:hypothetical protein
MSDGVSPTKKVLFRVVGESADDVNVETLWASDLGGDRYRLDNYPFFVYSVSLGDIVYAPIDPSEEVPTFTSVLEKSGNRTIRVLFETRAKAGNSSDATLKALVAMGCDYEGFNGLLIAVNVPAEVDLASVGEYLEESGLEWEHADPRYSELYPDEA